jgi:hypothetical protein
MARANIRRTAPDDVPEEARTNLYVGVIDEVHGDGETLSLRKRYFS